MRIKKGNFFAPQDVKNKYRYDGKEFIEDFDIGLYDYGARWYDPAVGRFLSVDPLADHPNQVDKSPCAYTWNNPVKLKDPDGKCPQCVWGFVIGFGLDVATQMVFEGKNLKEVDFANAAVSGVAGAFSGGISSISKLGKGAQLAIGASIDAGESVGKQVISGGELNGGQIISDVVMGRIGGQSKVFSDANIKVKENRLDRVMRIAGSNKVRSILNAGSNSRSIVTPKIQMAQDNTRVITSIIDLK